MPNFGKKQAIQEWIKKNPPQKDEIGYSARVFRAFQDSSIPTSLRYIQTVLWELKIELKPKYHLESPEPPVDSVKERMYAILKASKRKLTVSDLANQLDVGPKHIERLAEELRGEAKNVILGEDGVELQRALPQGTTFTRIDTKKFEGKKFKYGVTADNHLCSYYERLDVLEALFDIWQKEGVTEVLQLGNMIDGDASFNKFELLATGVENQVRYFIEHWPKRPGMRTLFIAGDDHEGWYVQREGVDIGRKIELEAKAAGRNDLVYLGYMEHRLLFGDNGNRQSIHMIHAGGGSSYAISYSAQKIVESYQPAEKPTILLLGHFHKYNVSYPRAVYTVQPGCTVDQSPFMRKKRLEAHVGGATLEFTLGADGLMHSIRHTFHPFYDRDFYKKGWHHPLDDRRPGSTLV